MLLLKRPKLQRKGWQAARPHPPPLFIDHQSWNVPSFSLSHQRGLGTSSSSALTAVPYTAAVATASGTSFFKLLLAFIAGGLFFTTAVAVATACYAIGMENVQRTLDICKIVVSHVWTTFTQGLGAARSTLLTGDRGSWEWRSAWRVLKEKLRETRKMAAQGVQAIRKQGNVYAAAVGAPGLIPLQYIIDRLLPFSIATQLQDGFKESLASLENKNHLRDLKLVSFSIGTTSPKLQAARIYDLGSDAMAFDCDVVWNSELEAGIKVYLAGGLARLPVTVKNVQFNGVVRVVLTPLVKQPPGYGAALISFPCVPQLGLDVRVAGGEVTRVPWLRSELMSAIQKGISDEFLWPRRMVIPSLIEGTKKHILSKHELENLLESDPLLCAEKELAEEPLLKENIEKTKPSAFSLCKLMKIRMKDDAKEKNRVDPAFETATSVNGDSENTTLSSKRHQEPLSRKSCVQSGILWERVERLSFLQNDESKRRAKDVVGGRLTVK